MVRYVKAILGGLLAVLAAFGWIVAIAFMIGMEERHMGY